MTTDPWSFDALREHVAADPWIAPPEPEPVVPLDLRGEVGVFTTDSSLSIRECHHCRRAIHVGRPRVNHRPVATSAVTYHYHEGCVILP